MKTKLLSTFVLAATVLSTGAQAQTPATPVAPTSPAPAVTPAAPAPNQVIYSPRLPTVAELTSTASAQGVTIERIDQSATQVTATYKLPGGQLNIVSYQLLPAASAVATTTPPPTVVVPAPSVVYYEPEYVRYPAYAPWYWYPPVSVHLGFGYGFRGGFVRGGFHR